MNPLFALIGGMVLAYSLFTRDAGKEKREFDSEQGHDQERGRVAGGDGGGLPDSVPAHQHHRGLEPVPAPKPIIEQPPVADPVLPSHPASGSATDNMPEIPGESEPD